MHLGENSSDLASADCVFSQIAPKSYAMKRADGELLELGEQLARAQPELARILRWVDEVWEMYAVEVRRRGTRPEDTAEWTWHDAGAYCAARECVERETEIGAAYVRAMDALDACYAPA